MQIKRTSYHCTLILILFSIILFYSCQEVERMIPKVSFDAPFEGDNRKLNELLGPRVLLKAEKDTFSLAIYSNDSKNCIVNEKEGDTLFNGTVILQNDLYYFSQQINDSSYWIYAVRVDGNLVRGLGRGWEQILLVQQLIEKGEYPQLVKSKSGDHLRLHPAPELMPELFAKVISGLPVDTLLLMDDLHITPDTNIWVRGNTALRDRSH